MTGTRQHLVARQIRTHRTEPGRMAPMGCPRLAVDESQCSIQDTAAPPRHWQDPAYLP